MPLQANSFLERDQQIVTALDKVFSLRKKMETVYHK